MAPRRREAYDFQSEEAGPSTARGERLDWVRRHAVLLRWVAHGMPLGTRDVWIVSPALGIAIITRGVSLRVTYALPAA